MKSVLTVILYARLVLSFNELFAATVKLYVVELPVIGELPDRTPVLEFNVIPDGRLPETTVYVIGVFAAVATIVVFEEPSIEITFCVSYNEPNEPAAGELIAGAPA